MWFKYINNTLKYTIIIQFIVQIKKVKYYTVKKNELN